jgi:hypothetical protein
MYPEVEEYFKIEEEAEAVYTQAHEQARLAYERARAAARDDTLRERARSLYNTQVHALDLVRQGTTNLAWANLQLSENTLVQFVARNCGQYRSGGEPYAAVILKMLPASLPQIRTRAQEGNWCGTFDQFVSQALAEGAVKDLPRSRERIDLETYIRRTYGGSYVNDMMTRVNKVLAAEATGYAEAMANLIEGAEKGSAKDETAAAEPETEVAF